MSGPMGRPAGRPSGPGAGGGPPHMGMMMPVQKSRNFRASFRRLLLELRPEAALVIVVIALGVVSVALAIIGPRLLGEATNVIFAGAIGEQLPAGVPLDVIVADLEA